MLTSTMKEDTLHDITEAFELLRSRTTNSLACDLYQLAQQSKMYKSTKLISENAEASIHNMLS